MRMLGWVLAAAVAVLGGQARAAHGHYTSGVEGIKAATLPGEGVYYRMYNAFYTTNKLKDDRGGTAPGKFEVDVFANVHRLIWSTPVKFLGGNLVVDTIIPLQNTDMEYTVGGSRAFKDSEFNLGDILVEPFVLAWHGARWDACFGVGLYMPTGQYDKKRQANIGKDFWTVMTTAGGTYYFDCAKTWSVSVLARYENHTKQRDTNITFGDDFHFEWGVGKALNPIVEVGAAGYCSWQLQADKGAGSTKTKERLFAAGPEVQFTIPAWKTNVSLRSLWEFRNRNATQGNITTLTITKAF